MTQMFKLEYDGELWEYAFAETDSALTWDGREDLIRETIRVYKSRNRTARIKGEGFEGQIKKDKVFSLGSIGGKLYKAEIDTERGERKVSLLVSKVIGHSLN